jgi:hypothetical protein
MCPNSAFQDQNFRPHSLHGVVIFGADGSGFFTHLGLLVGLSLSCLISLERFFRGFWWWWSLLSVMLKQVEDEEAKAVAAS